MTDQRDWPEGLISPPNLEHDLVEIVARGMTNEDGCCGVRDEDGRCCMSGTAREVLADLEAAGVPQAVLQAMIDHKAKEAKP